MVTHCTKLYAPLGLNKSYHRFMIFIKHNTYQWIIPLAVAEQTSLTRLWTIFYIYYIYTPHAQFVYSPWSRGSMGRLGLEFKGAPGQDGSYLEYFRWNCPPANATKTHWLLVNICTGSHQATSFYPCQCWPRCLSLYDATRPQGVN